MSDKLAEEKPKTLMDIPIEIKCAILHLVDKKSKLRFAHCSKFCRELVFTLPTYNVRLFYSNTIGSDAVLVGFKHSWCKPPIADCDYHIRMYDYYFKLTTEENKTIVRYMHKSREISKHEVDEPNKEVYLAKKIMNKMIDENRDHLRCLTFNARHNDQCDFEFEPLDKLDFLCIGSYTNVSNILPKIRNPLKCMFICENMKGYRDSFEKIAQIQGRVEYMKGEFSYEQMLQLNASCGRFLIKQLNENQIVNIIKLFHNNDIKKERNFTFVLDRHRNFSMNVFLRILGMEIRMTPTREQKGIEVKLLDRSMQGEAANLYVNKNSIIFIYPFDPDYNRTQEKYLYILH